MLDGLYEMIAADIEGSGCAFGGPEDAEGNVEPEVRCWGAHAERVPPGITQRPLQISVAPAQVCLHWDTGQVDCYAD